MDVEDWYHLDYCQHLRGHVDYSMLDGIYNYIEVLDKYNIKSSFFCLNDILIELESDFKELHNSGHDIGSHGKSHIRPLQLSLSEFQNEMQVCFDTLKSLFGVNTFGYRAPCFSLDRPRLDLLSDIGFKYDASKIDFSKHPLYGALDLEAFVYEDKNIYQKGDFFAFEANTGKLLGSRIPTSGGGYLRIFPWSLTKHLLKQHICDEDFYNLYIHPFELSKLPVPKVRKELSLSSWLRFSLGQKNAIYKLEKLINLFLECDYEFTTYREIIFQNAR